MHQLTQNVKLLQKAVLVHKNKILILQRSADSQSRPLCWDLPGGNCEWPQEQTHNQVNMHKQDIAREIQEETEITVSEEHFEHKNLIFFRTFYEASKDIYSIITGWKVMLPEDFDPNQVVVSREHEVFAWVELSELGNYDFGGKKGEFILEMIRAGVA